MRVTRFFRMSCVILPSETARLVYGYLVKENLNEIALLFLEQSPYLMDCCQIVKSGYQFNTKLMGKNLQELLQEYSVIHNLVNKKVSRLCKTSLLYKRIRLRCENLPEILELILFWKYKNCKSEESFQNDKSEKNINGNEVSTNCENLNSNEITETKNINPSNSGFNDSEQSLVQKSKPISESYSVNMEPQEKSQDQTKKEVSFDSDKKSDKELVCMPIDVNELAEAMDVSVNVNNDDENRGNNDSAELNLTIDVNSPCEDMVPSGITPGSLTALDGRNTFENQIKIVGVQEESQNENHPLNVFAKSLVQDEGNINLENSSVVFVSPDIGNVALNPEQSQIIVIPIDYYKSQEQLETATVSENGKEVEQQKNSLMFGEEASNAVPPADSLMQLEESNKTSAVDENIMTESDFLKNKTLVYNLEKEYQKATAQQPQKEFEPAPIQPVPPQQLIVVSQTLPSRSSRYRTILPKKEPPVQLHPVVVVQPLLESVKDSKTNVPNVLEPKRRDICGKVKKKVAKKMEKTESGVKAPEIEEKEDKKVEERTNEEKENMKTQMKKTETPVFVRRRNSKRLSLSTPRRRSHIRALEFETPPKTNDEKKKSRTSPKKVEHMNVERKCIRNTLFKSPTPEDQRPKISKQPDLEPLNELSIPIATRSPNMKLSDAWENLTGVGCVIGLSDVKSPKKMWDADLRCFIPQNNSNKEPVEKKRRKPERNQKDNRKSSKKKVIPSKRIKPITVSPSKISLTAKRNTYSINGNEEGSPIRSIDDLKLVTPFKDIETIRPTEETPLTKLLRENINTIDIDLSMINTPSFPPTPSIVITPDLDDVTIQGTNYYSPVKDCTKDKLLKITDYFRVDEKNNKKKMHDRVIDDLVSKAKEIIGLGKEQEETMKRRPSGKILSMVKIQMLTQCDKKLMENIPINENFDEYASTLIDQTPKTDLKEELEEKRKRALKKIKVVKENLRNRNRAPRGRKKTRVGSGSKSDKSNESIKKGVVHSTPYSKCDPSRFDKTDSDKKINSEVVEDIRQRFPPFKDSDKYPELNEKSRKKLYYVESFLKLPEVEKYIKDYVDTPPKLFLKPSLRKFFQVFYKWLKHPHKRELNASMETKAILKEYLSVFDKINKGLNQRCKKFNKSESLEKCVGTHSDISRNDSGGKLLSDDDEREWKKQGGKRKEEEAEDGMVSTLPLKKRKSTVVQQVEIIKAPQSDKSESKACGAENVSQTQNFLQDIDVDRFLSQIHGQENR